MTTREEHEALINFSRRRRIISVHNRDVPLNDETDFDPKHLTISVR